MSPDHWLRLLGTLAALLLLPGCDGAEEPPPHLRIPGGDAARGRVVIRANGCGACHVIPGVREARSWVGPPLTAYARRGYIAGMLPNAPDNLVRWLRNPQAILPGSAMPDLGLSEQEARDVATYLYTLGAGGAVPPPAGRPLTPAAPGGEGAVDRPPRS